MNLPLVIGAVCAMGAIPILVWTFLSDSSASTVSASEYLYYS